MTPSLLKRARNFFFFPKEGSDGVGRFLCPDYETWCQTRPDFEPSVNRVVSEMCGALFLDVGANIGKYSVLASKRGSRVIAVEPSPKIAKYLASNLAANGCHDYRIVVSAAWDKRERLTFYSGEHMGMGTVAKVRVGKRLEVQGETLDDILDGEIPSFIKMDANWAEHQAIVGLARTLSRRRIPMTFEANDEHDLADTSALLKTYGYRIEKLDPINYLARE